MPFKIQYRYRPSEYGEQLVRMYLLTNDVPSKLGQSPLPDGVVRVFRQNGRGGLSYLTQQAIKYIPVGDKIELNLGPDPEVIFELIKLKAFRDNIWLAWRGGRSSGGSMMARSTSTSTPRSSAGMSTPSSPSASATTPPSRSKSKSAAATAATSSSRPTCRA